MVIRRVLLNLSFFKLFSNLCLSSTIYLNFWQKERETTPAGPYHSSTLLSLTPKYASFEPRHLECFVNVKNNLSIMSHRLGSFQLQPLYGSQHGVPGLRGHFSMILSTLPPFFIFTLQLVAVQAPCVSSFFSSKKRKGCCFLWSLFKSEEIGPGPVWPSWLGMVPCTKRVLGSIPGQGMGSGSIPSKGHAGDIQLMLCSHIMFLSLKNQ